MPQRNQAESDLRLFVQAWNEARFFDAHETLEPRWIRTRDRGLRGMIQLAAAFHHLSRGNTKGARITLERAILRLQDPGNAPCPIDQRALASYAKSVLAELDGADPKRIVDNRPRLELQAPENSI